MTPFKSLRGSVSQWLVLKALDRIELTHDHGPRSVWSPDFALGCSPDFIIGRKDKPQVLRWFVIPRNRLFNIYLHCFLESDQDFALHTHPWWFNISYNWINGYIEMKPRIKQELGGFVHPEVDPYYYVDCQDPVEHARPEGGWVFRLGTSPHRVMLIDGKHAWTIFITGPKWPKWIYQWGFLCPKGFVIFDRIVKYKTNEGSEPQDGCP